MHNEQYNITKIQWIFKNYLTALTMMTGRVDLKQHFYFLTKRRLIPCAASMCQQPILAIKKWRFTPIVRECDPETTV